MTFNFISGVEYICSVFISIFETEIFQFLLSIYSKEDESKTNLVDDESETKAKKAGKAKPKAEKGKKDDDKDKKKKGPSQAIIAAMKETLRLKKEEEERQEVRICFYLAF